MISSMIRNTFIFIVIFFYIAAEKKLFSAADVTNIESISRSTPDFSSETIHSEWSNDIVEDFDRITEISFKSPTLHDEKFNNASESCSWELLYKYNYRVPSWCPKVNPLAGHYLPIFENGESIWKSIDPNWFWKPYCRDAVKSIFDSQTTCSSLSSITSAAIGNSQYILYGHYTGYVTFHSFTSRLKLLYVYNYLNLTEIESSEDNAIIWLDAKCAKESCFLLIGTHNKISIISFDPLEMNVHNRSGSFPWKRYTLIHEYYLEDDDVFIHAEIIGGGIKQGYSSLVAIRRNNATNLHFFQLFEGKEFLWTVENTKSLSISLFAHTHKFINRVDFVPTGTVSGDGEEKRVLILLYNEREVKILEYIPGIHITVRFDVESSVSSFYFNEIKGDNPSKIVSAKLVGDNVRSFNASSLSCQNVEFTMPSQKVYLVLGIVNSNGSTVLVRSVPELEEWILNEETNLEERILNPGGRSFYPDKFPCKNQYLNPKTSNCESIHSEIYQYNSLRIHHIEARTIESMKKDAFPFTNGDYCKMLRDPTSCYKNMITSEESCKLANLQHTWRNGIFLDNYITIFVIGSDLGSLIHPTLKHNHLPGDFLPKNIDILHYKWSSSQNNTLTLQVRQNVDGYINSFHVTANGLYSYISLARRDWELSALMKADTICDFIKDHSKNLLLDRFKPFCENQKLLDLGFFLHFSSMCTSGMLCPNIHDLSIVQPVPEGYFTIYPNYITPCPDGKYCIEGISSECPIGYKCSAVTLPPQELTVQDIYPNLCNYEEFSDPTTKWYSSRTCAFRGTGKNPPLCPNGSICLSPSATPIILPERYWIHYHLSDRNVTSAPKKAPIIKKCIAGMWCPLATFAISDESSYNTSRQLLCPEGTYCSHTNIISPIICQCNASQCDYCPKGSIWNEACPIGKYCITPTEAKDCPSGYSCSKEGTTTPVLCPTGYYCPNGIEIECPSGHYCKQGSISPIKCSILSVCPSGSSREELPTLSIIIVSLFFLFIVATQFVFGTIIPWLRSLKRFDDSERVALVKKAPRKQLSISFRNIEVRLRDGRTILSPLSGDIQPGRIFCILGSSGAGKTTFMNALRGRLENAKVKGKIFVNGQNTTLEKYASYTAFIPQDDIMNADLTVREIFTFTARAKLPITVSMRMVNKIVNQTLQDLGLEHVQHQIIGDVERRGISGGERKRASLGLGLVQEISCLFADEITSGLDSHSALSLLKCLKDITGRGYTLITILHQPRYEIFDMLDDILLLGKGGHALYCGPKDGIIPYFVNHGYQFSNNVNPCDYLLDISSGHALPSHSISDSPQENIYHLANEWRKYYSAHVDTSNSITEDNPAYSGNPKVNDNSHFLTSRFIEWLFHSPSYFWQFTFCFLRSLIQQIRDLKGLLLECSLISFSALCLGIVFNNKQYIGPLSKDIWENCPLPAREFCKIPQSDPVIQVSYLCGLSLYLIGIVASLKYFGGYEKVIFNRESSYLSNLPYFVGKNLANLPNAFLTPSLFLIITRYFIGFNSGFYEFYYIFVLTYLIAMGLGYSISLLLPANLALLCGVVTSLTLGFFAGNSPSISDIDKMVFPICYAPSVNPLRWTMEMLYLTEIKSYESTYDISISLERRSFKFSNYKVGVVVLLAWIVFIRIVAYFISIAILPQSFIQRFLRQVSWIYLDLKHFIIGRLQRKKEYEYLNEQNEVQSW